MPDQVDFICGLDLGQTRDPTALAVLQRSTPNAARAVRPPVPTYYLWHLERWPLGTPYPQIVGALGELLNRRSQSDPLRSPLKNCVLVVDGTGVGRAVVDMLRAAKLPMQLVPVVFTSGNAVALADGYWHVPKKDLAGAALVMLQSRRLNWHPELPLLDVLTKELANFERRVTKAANEVFVAAHRDGAHDDLALAVAMAAWWGERRRRPPPMVPYVVEW